ncbi:MAG: helix-turn-helix transcriptional regulator [Candidatus Levybacteria bacterium]|nr:helix-turn-helix transcriptional regulator [Candidatus Levybacteria bacterium]MBP9815534.1 helix-turn-helix transcriptional regulator [Candidatus Levybacteria bacterium]
MGKEAYSSQDIISDKAFSFKKLSPRKMKILELSANGDFLSEIAEKMGGLSVKTIQAHKSSITKTSIDRMVVGSVDTENLSELIAFSKRIITFLIIDGIINGNIKIEPPEKELKKLTMQETLIAELLGKGYSQTEVARQLYISNKTVEAHTHHLKEKMCARSITHLIARKTHLELTGEWDVLAAGRSRKYSGRNTSS